MKFIFVIDEILLLVLMVFIETYVKNQSIMQQTVKS